MFHNLRFGLLKSFKIMDDVEKSDYTLSSVSIAEEYGITQSTAWKFLKKLKENKGLVNQLLKENIGSRTSRIEKKRLRAISRIQSITDNEEPRQEPLDDS
jgi:DNA-binding IclR family transcriptional regulator